MTDDASPAPLLELRGVTKSYPPEIAALGPFSASLAPGRITALLGPSGCGKSTALRIIAGLEAPGGGQVLWPGLKDGAPRPGEIGVVFQDPTLLPWADVTANIALPLRLLRRRPDNEEEIIRRLISSVGLSGFERALPRTLSGGMRMRVSLARALVTEPKILLLDEPFAALDEITRLALNDALLDLKRERQLTCLFVTHSVFESVYLADDILVLSRRPGRIIRRIETKTPAGGRKGYRFTADYAQTTGEVSAALAAAMEMQ